MNYRHAFHAGNFADLVKHATLLELLGRMAAGAPLTVIDTHAGGGLYDLGGAEARRSGEAEAGIARLMAAEDMPAPLGKLKAAVLRANGGKGVRRYPGSPALIAEALRPADRYLACELRPEEHKALAWLMKGRANVETLCADGYRAAVERTPARGPALVLIDPPFERADDYSRIVETVAGVQKTLPEAVVMIWLPLKDLTTFDAFEMALEDVAKGPVLSGQCRVRPLSDPMKMNGCAVVLVGAPEGMAGPLEAVCRWTAETLGQGGEGRVDVRL